MIILENMGMLFTHDDIYLHNDYLLYKDYS